jgi:hypothetical protein
MTAEVAVEDKIYPGIIACLQGIALEATAVESSDDYSMEIMEKIWNAATEDDVFAAQEPDSTAGKDFLDRPFFLQEAAIKWRMSTVAGEQGLPFYAVFKAVEIATNEEVQINCGGKSFVAALRRLQLIDRDPATPADKRPFSSYAPPGRPLRFKGKTTAGGTTVLLLMPFVLPQQAKPGKSKGAAL